MNEMAVKKNINHDLNSFQKIWSGLVDLTNVFPL